MAAAARGLTRRLATLSLSHVAPKSLSAHSIGAPCFTSCTRSDERTGLTSPAPRLIDLTRPFRWFSSVPQKVSQEPEGEAGTYGAEAEFDPAIHVRNPDGSICRKEFVGAGLPEGEHYPLFLRFPKLKPRVVAQRINGMKTFVGIERSIRHSTWRMNLLCRFVRGMTVPEALNQLKFTRKGKAPLLHKIIRHTSYKAENEGSLRPSQLEIAECIATRGAHLKRLKIHARGKSGVLKHRYSHVRLTLREIDFPLKIITSESLNQKKRWYAKMKLAELDAEETRKEREEFKELERQAQEREEKEKANK